ncbi:MAG: TraM recognition domain-containing protein [Pseudomonadota bacterium]
MLSDRPQCQVKTAEPSPFRLWSALLNGGPGAQEIVRVYGKESLATILSQTDVKHFFGVASQETARLVSQMLGEEELPS